MTTATSTVGARDWRLAALAGVAIGVVYVLSPLTVWFLIAAVFLVRFAERGRPEDERRWLRAILVTAIALRVLAVVGLFILSQRSVLPFETFFGDEEFFIRRSIWLRNIALGIPIHSADLIYAFDEVGQTSYLYVLALVQALVGPSPYGVHLVGIAFYLGAAVLLYRLTAETLGRMPALVGLVLLLFLPSLFAWSISALKEPFFFLLTSIGIVLTVKVGRASSWRLRAAAIAGILLLLLGVESVRRVGAALTFGSLALGATGAWIVRRPRVLIATVVLVPIVAGALLSRPIVQVRLYPFLTRAGWQHAGHINTPGYVYKTLDERFYVNTADIDSISRAEAGRFLVRSFVDYLVVPLPWSAQSRAALAYIPEQIVWYLMLAVLPFGLVLALRRDPLVTSLLVAHALASAVLVAVTSGNIGTLVRHRGMAVPFLVWICGVGVCELVSRAVRSPRGAAGWAPVMQPR